MHRTLLLAAASAAAAILLTGCVPQSADAGRQPSTAGATLSAEPVSPEVLFDGPWLVEEGVWYLGPDGVVPRFRPGDQRTGLLDVVRRAAWVTGPALYGEYPVRVELYTARPAVPAWCEDVVEVSLDVSVRGLTFGSFESWSEAMPVPAGSHRIRLCTRGLDAAAAETADDEFDGDGYRRYSSRHLFQLWPAPPRPPRVVRAGSAFARSVRPH
ncbi:MAG: hypothetical protein R2731_02535 [Nocardioides sp.]